MAMDGRTGKRQIGEEEEEKGVEYFKSELIRVQKELIECQQQLLEHSKKSPVDKIEKEKIVTTVEEIEQFFSSSFSRQKAGSAREIIDECRNGCNGPMQVGVQKVMLMLRKTVLKAAMVIRYR